MNNLKKSASLEERAIIKIAIEYCQVNDFKEMVLCLEKPAYGTFIPCYDASVFISDTEKLARWAGIKKDDPEYSHFVSSCYTSDEKRLEQWEQLLEEQCQKLTEELPVTLGHKVQGWMNRMALEYLSYCRRQETLFGLSRYFLMDFVTEEDWSESGRLDEEKLAERLVKDERLTVLQRYRIACVYCLHMDSQDCVIASLWKQLTPEEKASLSGYDDPNHSSEKNRLVLLWSYYMDGNRDEKVTGQENYWCYYAIEQAVADGNRVALLPCWRWLSETARQSIIMKMACDTFYSWLSTQPDRDLYLHRNKEWRKNLVSVKSSSDEFSNARQFNLPFYYSDLLCFFLSEMSEADQLTFFKEAFQDKRAHYILECFLDWPHQDYFLPTINKLWDILPKYNYGRCLLILASKYSGDYDWQTPRTVLYTKEGRHYDYQSLLFQLWEETPEDYKRYLFTDKPSPSNPRWEKLNEGRVLLPRFLKRHPFEEADERFFKRVFNDLTTDEKKALIYSEKSGESIWSTLTWAENYPLLNWVFKECLVEKEVSNLKKQFVQSDSGKKFCFYRLKVNREKLLENLINWSFESNEERKEFKKELIYSSHCLKTCELLLCEDKFSEVERMMDFCLDSEEMKEKFKAYLARASSIPLLKNLDFGKLDRILTWCFDSEEKLVKFKKEIVFCERMVEIHYNFVFEKQWENVKRFYAWFGLSAEEIAKLKKETVFSDRCGRDMTELLYDEEDILPYLSYLRWCLIDEQIIIDFKKDLESIFSRDLDHDKHAKERLNHLIEELLSGFKKDTENKKTGSEMLEEEQVLSSKPVKSEGKLTSQLTYLVQTRGEKRAAHEVTEEESHSSSKRMAR